VAGRGADVTVELRPVQAGDYEYIVPRVDHWWGGRNMAALLPRLFFEQFDPTTRIAVDGSGRTVGFVCGFISQSDPELAYIHFVGVDPDVRGAGIGRTLYQWFLDQASAKGCTRVTCVTAPQNSGSRAFHAAMGFTERWVEDYDGHGDPRIVFSKELKTTQGA
jgi:ribosomal protein S18 acetylase RimI-like enzyme